MPRLPSPEDFGVELPRGERGFTPIAPDPSGKAVSDFASRVQKMAEEEADKLDRINVQDALTELSNAETDLAFGDDGYLKRKELATTNPDFAKPYQEKYDQHVNAIAAKLHSPRARELFMSEAAQKRMHFNRGLVTHVAREVDKAQDRSVDLKMQSIMQVIGHDPTQMDRQLVEFNSVAQNYSALFGADIDGFTKWINLKKGDITAAAARSAISQKNFDFAEKVLKEHGRLMGKEADDIRTTLDARKDDTRAADLSAEAIEMYRRGEDKVTVEEYIQKNAGSGDTLKVMRLARQGVTAYMDAEKAKHDETADTLYTEFTDGSRIRKTSAQIRGDVRYQSMPASHRKSLDELMDRKHDELVAESDRRTDAGRARKFEIESRKVNDVRIQDEVETLLNSPDKLAKMSIVELQGMQGRIGDTYTKTLVSARKQILTDAAGYKITNGVIESVLGPIRDKEKKKRAYLQVQPALEVWKNLPENKGRQPDTKTVYQIVANTALRLTKKGFLSDDVRYMWQYQDEGALPSAHLPVDVIGANGKKTRVEIPGDWVAQVLQDMPHLTEQQLGAMYSKYLSKQRK